MDIAKLLSETASSVAEAANAAASTETVSAVGPSPPLPTSFLAPAYLPPVASLSSPFPPYVAPTVAPIVADDEEESEEEFDEDNPQWAKWNCNQIRTKIRNFLGTKEMTQTAFLNPLMPEGRPTSTKPIDRKVNA